MPSMVTKKMTREIPPSPGLAEDAPAAAVANQSKRDGTMAADVSEATNPEAKDTSSAGDKAMAAGALKAYTAIKSSNPAATAPAKTKAELLAEILQSTTSSNDNASSAKPSSSSGGATDGLDYDSPYLLRRTAKDFGGQLFYGTVIQCRTVNENGNETFWYVVYDDGDDEDLTADGLAEGLVLFEQDQLQKRSGKSAIDGAAKSCCSVAGCNALANDGNQESQATTNTLCDFHRRVHRVVHEKISWEEAQAGLEVEGIDGVPMDESGLADTETEDEAGNNDKDGDYSSSSERRRGSGKGRGAAAAASTSSDRKSSRATKFQGNMGEDGGTADDGGVNGPTSGDGADKKKSPASTHSSPRKRLQNKKPVYDADTSSSEEDYASGDDKSEEESGDDEEKLKMERIIASRTETIKRWKEIGSKMNTTEVTDGSRWFQEPTDIQEEDSEERFLVKWRDLSMLHCSWETKRDLLAEAENPRPYFSTFQRKNMDGLIFDEDERRDGEFFDPSFVEIERILHVMEAPEPSSPPTSPSASKSTSPSQSNDGVRRRLDMDEPDSEKKGSNGNKEKEDDKEQAKDDKAKDQRKCQSIMLTKTTEEQGIILDRNDPRYEDGTGRQFLIKWGNTPYSECSYEFERDLVLNDVEYESHFQAFIARSQKPTQSEFNASGKVQEEQKRRLYKIFGENAKGTQEERDEEIAEYQRQLVEKEFGESKNKLRDYQAEGVAWLMSNYVNNRSSVLADEMGLGKTVQVASYLSKLAKESHIRGPFLVVVPLSTLEHWLREFAGWTDLNAILYHGSADDRALIREYEFAYHPDRPKGVGNTNNFLRRCQPSRAKAKWQRTWMAQVVITTPEIMTADDVSELMAVKWEVLVVDEAHRVKNFDSKLANNLFSSKFSFGNRVLMTGTPIQNNMQELWTILHFTDPSQFNNQEEFLDKFDSMRSKELLDELHEKMRPYILRRLKEDVEKSVPPKEETIIEVELTVLQKTYYRALYEKNLRFLHRNKKKALDGPSISNLAVQLRKCCNHPFLLRGCEDDARKAEGVDAADRKAEADFLVRASGKLVLLDKLLPRLQEGGHRILIFSQFCIMLDILTDYLDLRDFKHERIDGNITGKQRQSAIDRFQAEAQDGKRAPFVMLLSTRAGGVGINLTAADTCIIFDSDWNPQNDLQAQARCHRIGQTKSVKIYRLLTAKSYEMQMFHASSLKLGLDQAVLQGIEGGAGNGENAMSKDEIEKLLRKGAYNVFSEEQDGTSDKASKEFENLDIDAILSRRTKTVIHENTGSNSAAAGGTFSKASFKAANQGESAEVDIDDPDFWKKVVGEAEEEKEEVLGKRKRKQTTSYIQYFEEPVSKKAADTKADAAALKDSDYSSAGEEQEDDDEDAMKSADPINAADLANGNAASGRISIGLKGKKREKKRKKSSSKLSGNTQKKFIMVRGISIPYQERSKIKIFDSGPKILVMNPLPQDLLIRADEIVSINGVVVRCQVNAVRAFQTIQSLGAAERLILDIIRPVPLDYPALKRDEVTGYGYTRSFPVAARPVPQPHPPIPNEIRVSSAPPSRHSAPPPVGSPPELSSPGMVSVAIAVSAARPQLGVSVGSNSGRHFVHGITVSGAASATKLRVGDEIIGLNGKRYVDWTALLKEIHNVKDLGQPLRLDIVQHEKRVGNFIQNIVVERDPRSGKFGIDLKWRPTIKGVYVERVTSDAPAAHSSIRVHDEIISVNNTRVTGPDWNFSSIMETIRRSGGTSLKIDVFRPSQGQVTSTSSQAKIAKVTTGSASTTTSSNTAPTASKGMPPTASTTEATAAAATDAVLPSTRTAEPILGSAAWCALQKKSRAEKKPTSQPSKVSQNEHPGDVSVAAAPSTATTAHSDSADVVAQALRQPNSGVTGVLVKVEIPPRRAAASFGIDLQMPKSTGLPEVAKFYPFSVVGQTGKVKAGDCVLSINGRSTRATGITMDNVKDAFKSVSKDTPLTLEILRPTVQGSTSLGTRHKIIKGIAIHRNAQDVPFGVILHQDGDDKSRKVSCTGIKNDSPVMREGTLKECDVILAANGIDLTERERSFKEVLDLVRSTKPGTPLILDIMRTIEDDEAMPPGVKAPAATSERSNNRDAVSATSKDVSSKTTPPKERPTKKASSKEVSSTKAEKNDTSDQSQAAPATQQSPTAPVSATKRGRKKKDPNAPKGPLSAYIYFFSEMRSKLPGTNSSDASAHIGKEWKVLTPEQKKKYEDLSEKDKERYRKEMTEYKAKNEGTEGAGLANRTATATAKATPSSPTPPPPVSKTPDSKRKAPPQSAESSSKSPTKAKKSKSGKTCTVDNCTKRSQSGTNGVCLSHWSEQVKIQANANGASYNDMRVAKTFGTDVYFGSIKAYFAAGEEEPKPVALWNVVYDDGDEEDLNVQELAGALRLHNQKKQNDPKATGNNSNNGGN